MSDERVVQRALTEAGLDGAALVARASSQAIKDELRRRKLVRRSHFMSIVAAWAITVPSAALLGALIFYAVDWMR